MRGLVVMVGCWGVVALCKLVGKCAWCLDSWWMIFDGRSHTCEGFDLLRLLGMGVDYDLGGIGCLLMLWFWA